jgi:hypothetical protein
MNKVSRYQVVNEQVRPGKGSANTGDDVKHTLFRHVVNGRPSKHGPIRMFVGHEEKHGLRNVARDYWSSRTSMNYAQDANPVQRLKNERYSSDQ